MYNKIRPISRQLNDIIYSTLAVENKCDDFELPCFNEEAVYNIPPPTPHVSILPDYNFEFNPP